MKNALAILGVAFALTAAGCGAGPSGPTGPVYTSSAGTIDTVTSPPPAAPVYPPRAYTPTAQLAGSTVVLSWTPNAIAVAGYEVLRGPSIDNLTPITGVMTETTYQDLSAFSGLLPGSFVYYEIRAASFDEPPIFGQPSYAVATMIPNRSKL